MKATIDTLIFDANTRYRDIKMFVKFFETKDAGPKSFSCMTKDLKMVMYNDYIGLSGLSVEEKDAQNLHALQNQFIANKSKIYITIEIPGLDAVIKTLVYHRPNFFAKHQVDKYLGSGNFIFYCEKYFNIQHGTSTYEGIPFERFLQQISDNQKPDFPFIEKPLKRMQSQEWFSGYNYRQKVSKEDKDEITKKTLKKAEKKNKKNKEKNEKPVATTGEEKSFVNLKSLKITKGSSNPMAELDKIIGLNNVKEDIKKMQAKLEYDKNRRKRGIESDTTFTNHMVFIGNPGTGKTTVARIMTGILYDTKCIRENKCLEISGLDLQGGYVGQTGIITQEIINVAKGGVLFIDEAYALNRSTYGKEAISVLLKEIEDNRGDIVVIFAGYDYEMETFLDMNSGFRSRINKFFEFKDYSLEELTEILLIFLRKRHLRMDEAALIKTLTLFEQAKKRAHFSNGRFARNTVEKIEEAHILNVQDEVDLFKNDTITINDVPDELVQELLRNM